MFNLKGVRFKVLFILISFLAFALLAISFISYLNISSLGKYSKSMVLELGTYLANNSEQNLKKQSESFMENLAASSATLSNEILENISREVCTLEETTVKIYSNRENFKGSLPLLPDCVDTSSLKSKDYAFEKAYVVDPDNSSNSASLAYNAPEYYSNGYKSIYKTSLENWLALSENERNEIQNKQIVVSNNTLPQALKNELLTLSNIAYTIVPIYNQNYTISSAYLATESGILYKYSPDSSLTRFDPRTREWYTEAIEAKKTGNNSPVWQIPYVDKDSGKLCITCSKAFSESSGKTLGVIACDMYLSQISQQILNSKTNNSGYAFIVGKNGEIVMHPEYYDSNFNPYPLGADIDETYKETLNNMKEGNSGIQKAIIDGKEYYIAYSPMQETGWSFGIAAEVGKIITSATDAKIVVNDATGQTQNTISSKTNLLLVYLALAFCLCSFLSFIVSVIASKKITAPLKNLKQGVQKIGGGDLSINLKIETKDEIGELAAAFNKMVKDLNSYINELSETIADKEKVKSELSVAKKIQLSMLPCIFPAFPERDDFDIYAITDPAKEVGGDFYDFFFVDDNHLAVVIADVSGKGIPSALFMVIAKTLIKNQLQGGKSPEETLEIVNNQLCENNDADMFVTAFIGVYNLTNGEFIFSNAGHNPPFLYRSGRDSFEAIKMDHGFVLAGVKNKDYKNYKIHLSQGDVLFMYTDGVTEATKNNEVFSEQRLKATLNNCNIKNLEIKEMINSVKTELSNFYSGSPKFDDITIMAFKVMKKFPH